MNALGCTSLSSPPTAYTYKDPLLLLHLVAATSQLINNVHHNSTLSFSYLLVFNTGTTDEFSFIELQWQEALARDWENSANLDTGSCSDEDGIIKCNNINDNNKWQEALARDWENSANLDTGS